MLANRQKKKMLLTESKYFHNRKSENLQKIKYELKVPFL